MSKMEMPARIFKDAYHERLSQDPGFHEAIKIFCGFGRDLPAEILDEEIIDLCHAYFEKLGDWKKVGLYMSAITPRRERALARAVLMNLSKMRRENGGRLPWEQ